MRFKTLVVLILNIISFRRVASIPVEWSYQKISEWPANFPECGLSHQSPVVLNRRWFHLNSIWLWNFHKNSNFSVSKFVISPLFYPDFNSFSLSYFNRLPVSLKLSNNGHSGTIEQKNLLKKIKILLIKIKICSGLDSVVWNGQRTNHMQGSAICLLQVEFVSSSLGLE